MVFFCDYAVLQKKDLDGSKFVVVLIGSKLVVFMLRLLEKSMQDLRTAEVSSSL